jgi:Leucine-rich repeat (LRR) protein
MDGYWNWKDFEEFTENLKDMTMVVSLNFTDKHLGTVPDSISKFKNLEYLCLGNTGIESLPDWIGNLTNLKSLYLSNNDLDCIPECIGKLLSLTGLIAPEI